MTTGDTIAAFSSAIAPAARIILRVSGSQAHALAQGVCPAYCPAPSSATRQFLDFANLRFPAWVYSFVAPHSYTGEDLIEFHLPGNPVLGQMLLDELLRRGARLAEPGEFTARAYFSGKMDLTVAEGVAATIAASNEDELQAARQLLAGELARRVRPAMDLIAQTLALVEVGIDFSEEDVSFLPSDEILRRVDDVDGILARLLNDSSRFDRLVHEPRVVLVGRPNAGKSTLLNALANQQRAVISHIAGTTRDVLTAIVNLPHGRVQLMDVAGIDDVASELNTIDQQMRQHALAAVESADHIVLVQDATTSDSFPPINRPADLVVLTKADLLPADISPTPNLLISAHSGQGMDDLRKALDRLAFARDRAGVGMTLNRRHVAAIEEARVALVRATEHVSDNAGELIALELRESLDAIGQIVGSVTPDDVLGRIFGSFCIGK